MKKILKGISTIDLAIWIGCVAILLSVAWPNVNAYMDSGRRSKAIGDISLLSSAISNYHQQMKAYPTSLDELTASNPYTDTPWILRLPKNDPWGTTNTGINGTGGTSAYAYAYTEAGFGLWSLGKDKTNNSGGSGTSLPAEWKGDDIGYFGQ